MKISLRRRLAQMIVDGAFNHKMDWLMKSLEILNLKGHQNRIIGSKVTAILLNGWVMPIGGVVSEESAPAACPAALFLPSPQELGTRSGCHHSCLLVFMHSVPSKDVV